MKNRMSAPTAGFRHGFTLMELLLTVAILAVVAAMAAPQFFRSAEATMNDALSAQAFANFQTISAAISDQLAWEAVNPEAAAGDRLADGDDQTFSAAPTSSRIGILVRNGFMSHLAVAFGKTDGSTRWFSVQPVAVPDPSLPPFLKAYAGYHVHVGTLDLSEQVHGGTAWSAIWPQL